MKKGAERKKHVFKKHSKSGKNVTKPTKYTEKYVLRELKGMLKRVRESANLGDTPILYKMQLFENKAYTSEMFSIWVNKFKDNEKIIQTTSKIDEILKSRAWVMGIQGLTNASMTKFHLINNCGAAKESIELTGAMQHTLMMREIIKKSREVEE